MYTPKLAAIIAKFCAVSTFLMVDLRTTVSYQISHPVTHWLSSPAHQEKHLTQPPFLAFYNNTALSEVPYFPPRFLSHIISRRYEVSGACVAPHLKFVCPLWW